MWAPGFTNDQTAECRILKCLNIVDERTKHALAINVNRLLTGDDIVAVLERLVMIHKPPGFVRMDNGIQMPRGGRVPVHPGWDRVH